MGERQPHEQEQESTPVDFWGVSAADRDFIKKNWFRKTKEGERAREMVKNIEIRVEEEVRDGRREPPEEVKKKVEELFEVFKKDRDDYKHGKLGGRKATIARDYEMWLPGCAGRIVARGEEVAAAKGYWEKLLTEYQRERNRKRNEELNKRAAESKSEES